MKGSAVKKQAKIKKKSKLEAKEGTNIPKIRFWMPKTCQEVDFGGQEGDFGGHGGDFGGRGSRQITTDHQKSFTIVAFERERRNAQGVLGKA